MKAKHRSRLADFRLTFFLLISTFYLFYFVVVWGLMDYFKDGMLKTYVSGPGIHVELLISAVGFAATMLLVDVWSDSTRLRRRPFGQIILIKSGVYVLCLLVVASITNVVLLLFVFPGDQLMRMMQAMTGRLVVSIIVSFIVSVVAVNFLREVRRKVGPGNLAALISGRYHRPKSEDRLFLFIDLQGSTTIAETLGHRQYSQLLNECFHDLTDFVLESGASIYQYVGDEVVLTWTAGDAVSSEQCLEAFFGFDRRLAKRSEYYEHRFGHAPQFRAGADVGSVTATEVGDIKRDIAYHGDPLNTAARLLELCKTDGRRMLISDRVQTEIRNGSGLLTNWIGDFQLRGKAEKVGVYGVSSATAS
ncbi:MAG: adenylate/guanylate cyclase domain-containing protein [Rhodothermales bacterium]|nr:adenylate/guanylate cyclase domain-containing protein [Rhodothermales bacterium]